MGPDESEDFVSSRGEVLEGSFLNAFLKGSNQTVCVGMQIVC